VEHTWKNAMEYPKNPYFTVKTSSTGTKGTRTRKILNTVLKAITIKKQTRIMPQAARYFPHPVF
jgi:hypothetical protein